MQLPDVPILSRASREYKMQRAALLDEERALLDHAECVAEQRRSLPAGPGIEDYTFQGLDGTPVRMSVLFGARDVLLAYNMMFAPGDDAPCPMCTRWVDGFNALAQRVADSAPFVIFSRAPVAKLKKLAQSRGWTMPIYSAPQAFSREIGAETNEGNQRPIVTVFRRDRAGAISLWYEQCAEFPNETYRGIDLLNPLWGLLDLLPAGRGEYLPPDVVLA
jgi:predicted dithiol-disulfide oxidoreductase (DUF899 family)